MARRPMSCCLDRSASWASISTGASPRELWASNIFPFTFRAMSIHMRERYGNSDFGDNSLRAARLIESGSRFVTVNMFSTVYDTITWDCHAAGGSLRSELSHYKTIGAMFDVAYSALLNDLDEHGLLESTLVVATGEFGRTPHLNRDGGRDHWAGVWTALLAGGGVRGGQVIGSSDRHAGEPSDCPVGPEQFAASIRHALGLPSSGEPIRGLFA